VQDGGGTRFWWWPAIRWSGAGARMRRRGGEPNLGFGEERGSPEYAVRGVALLGEGDRR
jgi:hypothetical protein